ncbi:MAG: MoxR family ATPase [Myxococcota bacterium]|nr:MoxR family ATPase [Myxococcota bacterium]
MTVTEIRQRIYEEMARGFVGPQAITDLLLVSLFSAGHVLLEGVPGVAKTTVARRFSDCLGCQFSRVQFTQDLLPSDVTGTHIFNMQNRQFEIQKGPIFSQIVLGDEINRAPPKAQSALLEAMQEQQVTIDGRTFDLPDPFLVIATRNPIEQAGVYPLPEAQIDRFLICIKMDYPSHEDEVTMLSSWRRRPKPAQPVLDAAQIAAIRSKVMDVHVSTPIAKYVVDLAQATRNDARTRLGISPRGAVSLLQASRSNALLDGRDYVIPDDIKLMFRPVLSHRLILTPESQFNGHTTNDVLDACLGSVEFSGPASRV